MCKFLMILLWASIGFANDLDNIATLQNKLAQLKSMTANFSQIIYVKQRVVSRSSGNMSLRRPVDFRWETQQPLQQLIIANGKKIWIYDVDLEQVTIQKQQAHGTMTLFLGGNKNIMVRDFNVSLAVNGKIQLFNLKAKSPDENFYLIKLGFLGEQLISIEFFDKLAQHTVIKLSQIKINNKLSDTVFSFKFPHGVDIIYQ